MEFFILVAISIIFGRYALKVFNARRHFTLPSTLKIEKISEDFGNEAITKAQRLEIEDLLEIAEANGFFFDYWQRLTSDRPVINLVTAVLRSADNTICLQVAVENQGNPASIEMNTDFSDGAQIITLSPFGETVDDSDYQFSFAFDAQIAIDHHHKQIEKMSFLHGNPIVFENFEDDLASDECYRTHFRDRT